MLAGFSQGGAIALQTALRYRERLAGTLALSTYLPLAATLAANERSAANRDAADLHGARHARSDDSARSRAQRSRDALGGARLSGSSGASTRCRTRSACEEIADIAAWLTRVL